MCGETNLRYVGFGSAFVRLLGLVGAKGEERDFPDSGVPLIVAPPYSLSLSRERETSLSHASASFYA